MVLWCCIFLHVLSGGTLLRRLVYPPRFVYLVTMLGNFKVSLIQASVQDVVVATVFSSMINFVHQV